MSIKGFQGTSLLDFPGRIASLVFWGGCNLTCPFCHNPGLVLDPDLYPDIAPADILSTLNERKSFIDGVVVSGGEPTLDPNLPVFLKEVKGLGLAVKVDTNGLAPQVLQKLINDRLVDYLAIDLKTAPERYNDLHPGAVAYEKLLDTIRLCAEIRIDLEYRTTCVPGWIDASTIENLGRLIEGAPFWAFQQYHPENALCENARRTEAFDPEQVQAFADIAARYVEKVTVRGI